MAYFFISYSHRDSSAVRMLCDVLRKHGIDFWRDDERLDETQDLDRQIRQALADAAGVVVCISQFMQHTYGYVYFEHMLATGAAARAGGSKIVVARLNDAKLSPDFVFADAVVDCFEVNGPDTLALTLKNLQAHGGVQPQPAGVRTGEEYFAALHGLTGSGPIVIGGENVNLDLIGRNTGRWYKHYQHMPAAKQVLDDIAAERPFFSVNDDVTRAAYLSGKAIEAIDKLADSTSTGGQLWEMLALLEGDGGGEPLRELALHNLGPKMLEVLRTQRVSGADVRGMEGPIAHWLIFVLIPGARGALEAAIAQQARDRLEGTFSKIANVLEERNWTRGHTGVVTLFAHLRDDGDVEVSATFRYVPPPSTPSA